MKNSYFNMSNMSSTDRCFCQIKEMEIRRINKNIRFQCFIDGILKVLYIVFVFLVSTLQVGVFAKLAIVIMSFILFSGLLNIKWEKEDEEYHKLNYVKSQMYNKLFKTERN